MHGRYRGDMRLLATPDQGIDVRVRVLVVPLTLEHGVGTWVGVRVGLE